MALPPFAAFYAKQELRDLLIISKEGRPFRVHKLVICFSSPEFERLAEAASIHPRDISTRVVRAVACDPHTLHRLIQFAYMHDYQNEDKDIVLPEPDPAFGSSTMYALMSMADGDHNSLGQLDLWENENADIPFKHTQSASRTPSGGSDDSLIDVAEGTSLLDAIPHFEASFSSKPKSALISQLWNHVKTFNAGKHYGMQQLEQESLSRFGKLLPESSSDQGFNTLVNMVFALYKNQPDAKPTRLISMECTRRIPSLLQNSDFDSVLRRNGMLAYLIVCRLVEIMRNQVKLLQGQDSLPTEAVSDRSTINDLQLTSLSLIQSAAEPGAPSTPTSVDASTSTHSDATASKLRASNSQSPWPASRESGAKVQQVFRQALQSTTSRNLTPTSPDDLTEGVKSLNLDPSASAFTPSKSSVTQFALKESLVAAQEKNREYETMVAGLGETLRARDAEIEQLSGERAYLMRRASEMQVNLTQALHRINSENQDKHGSLDLMFVAKVRAEERDRAAKIVEKQLQAKDRELTEATNSLDTLSAEYEDLQYLHEKLKRQAEELKTKCTTKDEEIAALKDQLQASKSSSKAPSPIIQELQDKVEEVQKKAESWKQLANLSQGQQKVAREEAQGLKTKCAKQSDEIAELKKHLQATQKIAEIPPTMVRESANKLENIVKKAESRKQLASSMESQHKDGRGLGLETATGRNEPLEKMGKALGTMQAKYQVLQTQFDACKQANAVYIGRLKRMEENQGKGSAAATTGAEMKKQVHRESGSQVQATDQQLVPRSLPPSNSSSSHQSTTSDMVRLRLEGSKPLASSARGQDDMRRAAMSPASATFSFSSAQLGRPASPASSASTSTLRSHAGPPPATAIPSKPPPPQSDALADQPPAPQAIINAVPEAPEAALRALVAKLQIDNQFLRDQLSIVRTQDMQGPPRRGFAPAASNKRAELVLEALRIQSLEIKSCPSCCTKFHTQWRGPMELEADRDQKGQISKKQPENVQNAPDTLILKCLACNDECCRWELDA